MAVEANKQQREQWNDRVQATRWPKRERITTCVTGPLLDWVDLKPGERVLEVGSGGGLAAIEAAKRVAPSGRAVGFDLSGPLVELAKQRAAAAKAANAEFFAGDAQTDDIPGGPFDAVMSQFGVMFFEDPVAAFSNIRRHLRPGGRLTFACWQPAAKNVWFPGPLLAKYMPAPPPNPGGIPAPGPFAFGDPSYPKDVLERAGFEAIERGDFAHETAVRDDSLMDRETVDVMRVDEDKKDAAWREVQQLAESLRGSDGHLHLRLSAHFFSARNPG